MKNLNNILQMSTKTCIKCSGVFDITMFSKNGKDINGNQKYKNVCTSCGKNYHELYKSNQPKPLKYTDPNIITGVNKKCNVCQLIKLLNDFPKNGFDKLKRPVYKSTCKECVTNINNKNKLSNIKPIIPDPYLSDGNNKLCGKCHKIQPISNFSSNKNNKDKLNKNCRSCVKLYMDKWYTTVEKISVNNKLCIKCNCTKPINEFPKNKLSKDNHSDYCKNCTTNTQNTILNDNPDLSGDSMCLRCNETKPKTQFYLKRTRKEGIHQWCKKCVDEVDNIRNKHNINRNLSKNTNSSSCELTEKICTNCNIIKSVNDFYIKLHTIDGYSHHCKSCMLVKKQQYVKNNEQGYKDYWKQYRQDNTENRVQRWNVSIQEKKCTNCQQIKPANDFVKHYWNSDGLGSNCSDCRQNYNKKWQQQNPDYGKQYYINNKEICDLKWKEYYKINREKILLNQLKYRDLYKEVERERRIKKRMLDIKARIDKGLGEGDSIVYFIKFSNKIDNEVFFKIGVTNRTVQERFKQPYYKDYTYEILLEKYYDNNDAYIVESLLIKQHREIGLQYIPNNKFPGYTECFVELEWDFINSIP